MVAAGGEGASCLRRDEQGKRRHAVTSVAISRSVLLGPLATKPTPRTMRAMPSQRVGEMVSCSHRRPMSAVMTLPKAVAGWTKVRVGPGEGRHVRAHKADEDGDAGQDPGVEQGMEEQVEVLRRDGADLPHAFAEQGIAPRRRQA